MALDVYFSSLVQVMDKWVIVVSALVVLYLAINFRRFYRRYVATTYILALTLFIFWSIRAIAAGSTAQTSFPVIIMSFLLDVAVIVFAASIVYHHERLEEFGRVRSLFGLQHERDTEVIEYGGPEMEDVEPGTVYLVLERGFSYPWTMFTTLNEELPGLVFSRSHPGKAGLDLDKDDITYYWLSNAAKTKPYNTIEPFRRGEMMDIITTFVDEHENPVILIDSLEYLFYKNSPQAVTDFIQNLHDKLTNRQDITVIYSLEEGSIPEKHLALLREEVEEVRWMDDDGSVTTRRY